MSADAPERLYVNIKKKRIHILGTEDKKCGRNRDAEVCSVERGVEERKKRD